MPISTLCYEGVPPEKNNNVSGMTNLARNLGGSLGIASISIILSRRSQFHQNVLVSHITGPAIFCGERVAALTHTFVSLGVDPVVATQRAYGMIYGSIQRQATMLGYLDAVFVFACILALMTPAAFLMKKVKGRAPEAHGALRDRRDSPRYGPTSRRAVCCASARSITLAVQ